MFLHAALSVVILEEDGWMVTNMMEDGIEIEEA